MVDMDLAELAARYRRGQTYIRRQIHDMVRGQEQGGISTPRSTPAILLFSNEQGADYGYKDGWKQPDGYYHYTGEGQSGDMEMVRGNKAIRDHHKNGKVLMLFEGVERKPGLYRFAGFMHCVDYYEKDTDALGNERRVFVFRLVSIDDLVIPQQPSQSEVATAFLDMRPGVLAMVGQGIVEQGTVQLGFSESGIAGQAGAKEEFVEIVKRMTAGQEPVDEGFDRSVGAKGGPSESADSETFDRDADFPTEQRLPIQMPLMHNNDCEQPITHRRYANWQLQRDNPRDNYQASIDVLHQYILQRANGFCEACGRPAPFFSKDGSPYLEIHSVRSIVDYGLEQPNALIAMCPACHREAHVGLESREMAPRLDSTAANIESALDRGILKLVTAAIIRDDQGRILVAQRAKGQFAGYWEFPGGQVKCGETLRQCLVREIREELSVDIHNLVPLMKIDYDYETFFLRMFCFACQAKGTLELHDHTRVRWMAPQELASLKWMLADEGIVGELGGGK
jgi:mutator protein MutT